MQIECPQCHQSLTFKDSAPKFCQHCGKQLAPAVATRQRSNSLGAGLPADSMATVPPSRTIDIADVTIPPSGVFETATAEPPQKVGEVIGPYQTTNWLGAGGMGNVWQAVEQKTGRRVALKQLCSAMVNDTDSVKRFHQEAKLAAQISHPHVTFIYGTGNHQGSPYIAMELMPGTTIEDEVEATGSLSVQKAVDYVINIIDGLQAVHAKGMIHRDIKPSNCFIDANSEVKIGDFGLSKSVISENANLTKTGTFMGTPSYASPEQIRGQEIDARTDLYSVGATLYFMLTGQTPYRGDATSMMAQIIGDPPPSARSENDQVPRDLDLIIRKSLAKSPDDRFPSLKEFRAALLPYASRFESVADVGRRLAAYMIDQSLIQIVAVVCGVTTILAMTIYQGSTLSEDVQAKFQISITLGVGVVLWLYYSLGEGIFERTVGKWLMGLKLVNYENQKAGFVRAGIRAAIVPCSLGLSMMYGWYQYQTQNFSPTTNPADFILSMMFGLAIGFGPVLICMVTMRRSNRLMGIHGLVSGTRVVRASQVAKKSEMPITSLRTKETPLMEFGPYQSDQLLGEFESGKVHLAHDAELDRDVWIVTRENKTAPDVSRMSLSRHARQRWIDGGDCSGSACLRWDGYEAVLGIPIQQVVAMGKPDQCGGYARLMRQLVQELIAAVADGSLPEQVRLSQVWVNEDGHIKLLDSRLVSSVAVSDKDSRICPMSGEFRSIEMTPVEHAVELLQMLGDIIHRSQVLPQSLNQFLVELDAREKRASTLDWADTELARLEKKNPVLTWDIRIGVLALTLGVEALAFSLVASGLWLVCFYMLPMAMEVRYAFGIFCSLLLPMGLAAYFNGGFVFRVMGIQVCDKYGRPASAAANMVRAGLSWLPLMCITGAMILSLIYTDAQIHESASEPGSVDYETTHNENLVLIAALSMLASMLISTLGVFVAILSPKRGIIDFLLGTRLMPD
ncbi:MAG: protein kinase [Planctomycetota bacterium]